ncbi:acylase [Sandaracinomonas limnophila]|uniref:Acylase n=1 Tax=Sandaracinomonas limnophila TaxID=1862386 RepID=A0A437PX79_9BACT|nr:penicillin acylase family protein [Sandaracinomonas limnophila]RVU26876.1 acylase [Sandaracinomonas limnophila]
MKKYLLFFLLITIQSFGFTKNEIDHWKTQAKHVKIIRDKFGVPHIYGKSDADVVFGLMYAQCEDDFQRVEMNYITMLGRTSEIKGKEGIYDDLLVKMVIDSTESVKDYHRSPIWLKKLLNAFADGVNYYLYKHPEVKPAVLAKFHPWFPLTYTDGSISAIQTSNLKASDIKNFYEGKNSDLAYMNQKLEENNLSGSNGFAISPAKSKSGNAMLYINPHVTFYFRPEVHLVSEEGLNAYGAVTWGQFFVYQGFNPNCGWMHTSSNADVADLYSEQIQPLGLNSNQVSRVSKIQPSWLNSYLYEGKQLPVKEKKTRIYYKSANGIEHQDFTIYSTHHGPIMAKQNDHWISMKSNNRSLKALMQSWLRTKSRSFAEFKKTLDLRANVSNNTVYADREGNIAYWHGNFMPKRNPKFDWSGIVDGTTKATEWQGLHSVKEIVHFENPSNGWLQNCNSTPFTAAGIGMIDASKFPTYMSPDVENFRGINAVRLFSSIQKIDLDELRTIGYDRHLAAFDVLIPSLLQTIDQKKEISPDLFDASKLLKNWDRNSSKESIATTIAILWGEKVMSYLLKSKTSPVDLPKELQSMLLSISSEQKLNWMKEVMSTLQTNFGTWKVAWGDLNRFQRIENKLDFKFDDLQESLASPFASSQWGSLPSFNSKTFGTKKRYGYGGNSFICAVEFGKKIKAKSLLAGGESGNILNPHFKDQAQMYVDGQFKEVLFYKDDVLKGKEKEYWPGEEL